MHHKNDLIDFLIKYDQVLPLLPATIDSAKNVLFIVCISYWLKTMEDGVVDTIVIDSWQHKMGQMADFPPLLAPSVFDL